MQSGNFHPGSHFLLIFIVAGLLSLKSELKVKPADSFVPAAAEYVFIEDPQFGADYYSIKPNENLGHLVSTVLPRLAPLLADSCQSAALEEGIQIHLHKEAGSEKRTCSFSQLPEQGRYLLGLPLNVNRAQEEEFMLLPGIGNKLAKKIVRQREIKGFFISTDDLSEISGIGKKLLERLEGCLTI